MKLLFSLARLFFLIKPEIPASPKNILVMRSGAIGDVIMTTPLLRGLRKRYPEARISYLVGEWSKNVLDNNRNIDEVITFRDDIIVNKKSGEVFKLIKRLREKRFDLAIVLDKSYLWSLFAFRLRARVRIGFDRAGEGFANHYNVKFNGAKSEVAYYLDVGKLLGIEETPLVNIFVSKKDVAYVKAIMKKHMLVGKPLIGIAPGGAENPGQAMVEKRWPKDNYVRLARELVKNNHVLMFGGNEDFELCDEIASEVASKKLLNLAGKCNIQQSAALIDKCRAFVCHDSGTMHIASATKTKLIALFGPTEAERFAPGNAVVIKSKTEPSYDAFGSYDKEKAAAAMKEISVEEVLKELS